MVEVIDAWQIIELIELAAVTNHSMSLRNDPARTDPALIHHPEVPPE